MRKSALAAGTLAAVGLMATAGGTAFADSGQPVEPTEDVQNTSASSTVATDQNPDENTDKPFHILPAEQTGDANTQAGADASRSVVGLAVPVSADLHEGVANDLNVSDVVHLGKTDVPANVSHVVDGVNLPVGNGSGDVNAGADANAEGDVNAGAEGGGDATAQATTVVNGVGHSVGNVVAQATATVGNVVNLNGLASGGVNLGH